MAERGRRRRPGSRRGAGATSSGEQPPSAAGSLRSPNARRRLRPCDRGADPVPRMAPARQTRVGARRPHLGGCVGLLVAVVHAGSPRRRGGHRTDMVKAPSPVQRSNVRLRRPSTGTVPVGRPATDVTRAVTRLLQIADRADRRPPTADRRPRRTSLPRSPAPAVSAPPARARGDTLPEVAVVPVAVDVAPSVTWVSSYRCLGGEKDRRTPGRPRRVRPPGGLRR